jgi:hypothetical protein
MRTPVSISPPEDPAIPVLAQVARNVLACEGGEGKSSEQVVAVGAATWTKLSQHLSSLIGDAGFRVFFDRSLRLTGAKFPWMATAAKAAAPDHPWIRLRACLETQDPDVAIEASVALLATFLDLIGIFIGEALTLRILHQIWPEVAPTAPKETT